MGVLGAFGDLGRSIIGSPKKAVLIVHPEDFEAKGSSPLGGALQALAGAVGTALGLSAGFSLEVQYNPSTISINANADWTSFQYMQQNVDNGIPNQQNRPPSIVMTVELTFDDVSIKDAFMLEKFRMQGAGDIIGTVAGVAKNLLGKGYTVQPETNGLIALLMRSRTRLITFQWEKMKFTGILKEAQARYTMFSVSGKPVRSVVKLNIAQGVENDEDDEYWDKAFDKAFGKMDISNIVGGHGVGQMMGNVLNI